MVLPNPQYSTVTQYCPLWSWARRVFITHQTSQSATSRPRQKSRAETPQSGRKSLIESKIIVAYQVWQTKKSEWKQTNYPFRIIITPMQRENIIGWFDHSGSSLDNFKIRLHSTTTARDITQFTLGTITKFSIRLWSNCNILIKRSTTNICPAEGKFQVYSRIIQNNNFDLIGTDTTMQVAALLSDLNSLSVCVSYSSHLNPPRLAEENYLFLSINHTLLLAWFINVRFWIIF